MAESYIRKACIRLHVPVLFKRAPEISHLDKAIQILNFLGLDEISFVTVLLGTCFVPENYI